MPLTYTTAPVRTIAALEARRRTLGMTASQVSLRMGRHRSHIRNFETYRAKPPVRDLEEWAATLRCSLALVPHEILSSSELLHQVALTIHAPGGGCRDCEPSKHDYRAARAARAVLALIGRTLRGDDLTTPSPGHALQPGSTPRDHTPSGPSG